MKQKQHQLEAPWGNLFSTSVECVSRLLPGCNRLDRLVHTVNGIARATDTLNAGCASLLDDCYESFLWLIPRCEKIGHVVNATRCIARVMRRFGLEWSTLLNECRHRLMQLLPECEELTTAVRVINCIVSIAPLISIDDEENAPSPDKAEHPGKVLPLAPAIVTSHIIEIPRSSLQGPALARERNATSCLLRGDRP